MQVRKKSYPRPAHLTRQLSVLSSVATTLSRKEFPALQVRRTRKSEKIAGEHLSTQKSHPETVVIAIAPKTLRSTFVTVM